MIISKEGSMLLDLLSLIHDGGDYTVRHGLEKSVTDAEAKIYRMREYIDELEYRPWPPSSTTP
jgi:hypothetical protein